VLSPDGAGTVSALLLVLAIGVVLGILLAAFALLQLRRQRRLLAVLVDRLDQAEGVEAAAVEPGPSPGRAPSPGAPRDVLAGRTSYVAAMVAGTSPDVSSLADRAIVAIHQRLEDPLTPAQLADALNVSLRSLERVLAAALECTPRQLILTVKMREARRLLATGQARIGEVAFRLGFPSAAHFSTRFRSFFGCPPSSLLRPPTALGGSGGGRPRASGDEDRDA
jgi:AraC-like DNA-binding protein